MARSPAGFKSVLTEQPYGAKQSKGCKLWLCTNHSRVYWCMRVAAYELKNTWERARELAACKALACTRALCNFASHGCQRAAHATAQLDERPTKSHRRGKQPFDPAPAQNDDQSWIAMAGAPGTSERTCGHHGDGIAKTGRAWTADDSDVESILSISASSSSRGYTLPPRDSSVHESPLAEVPELHLLELEEQVTNYEKLTRQMAAEKGATLPDLSDDDLPLDRAERLKARFARVANLHESLEATLAPCTAPPAAARRDRRRAARGRAASISGGAEPRDAVRAEAARLPCATCRRSGQARTGAAGAAAGHDGCGRGRRSGPRRGPRGARRAEEKLAALRTVPVQRLFERRALRTRRSLFAAWREAAAEEKRAADGLRRGITIMRRNVSRWRRAALRRALDVWAERANARYVPRHAHGRPDARRGRALLPAARRRGRVRGLGAGGGSCYAARR